MPDCNRSAPRGGDSAIEWILLDFNTVVVHLMRQQTRRFYDLERLWGDLQATRKAAEL